MAKEEDRTPISENRADTVFYDKYGNVMVRISFSDAEYEQGETDIRETTSENVECGDGSLTSLRQVMQGAMLFAVCDVCKEESQRSRRRRRPAVVPFSPANKVLRCVNCRAAICDRHSYSSRHDRYVRCRRCNRRHHWGHFWLERVLKPLFLRRIDET